MQIRVKPDPAPALGTKADFIQAHRPIYDPELKQDDGTFEQDFGAVYDSRPLPQRHYQDQRRVSAFRATLKKYSTRGSACGSAALLQNVVSDGQVLVRLAGLLTTEPTTCSFPIRKAMAFFRPSAYL